MTSLYDLVGKRLALQNKLEALDFDTQVIEDTLSGDDVAINNKVDDYCFVRKNKQALIEAMKDEENRLKNRRLLEEKALENIDKWLLINFKIAKLIKIKTTSFTIALQNNPPSVVIDDEELIPEDYFRHPKPPPFSVDKELIEQAIKDGYTVPGAHLETKQRLVIK